MAYVRWLHDGGLDREQVGGKGASLPAMIDAGFPVPDGFCITADGYRRFAQGALASEIASILGNLDTNDRAAVSAASQRIVELVSSASVPDDLRDEIVAGYETLCRRLGEHCAVRSSAISEDS